MTYIIRPEIRGVSDFIVCEFGHDDCAPSHAWGPGVRSTHLLHYVSEGHGFFVYQDTEYPIGPGNCFYIPPDTKVYYKAHQHQPWTYWWLGFTGAMTGSLMAKSGFSKSKPVIYMPGLRGDFISCVQALNEFLSMKKAGDLYLLAEVYRLFSVMAESNPRMSATSRIEASSEYVGQCKDFILFNLSRQIRVSAIAGMLGLHADYLNAIFKKETGVSIRDYILESRMRRASELLMNHTLNVSDVSRSVGYEDPLLFSKMFKRVMGISPRAFRNDKLH